MGVGDKGKEGVGGRGGQRGVLGEDGHGCGVLRGTAGLSLSVRCKTKLKVLWAKRKGHSRAVLDGPHPPTVLEASLHPVVFSRSPGLASRSAHLPSDIELTLREYQRAREEAKVEIAQARDRLRERTEQEKLRIRQQILCQLLRVGRGTGLEPGADPRLGRLQWDASQSCAHSPYASPSSVQLLSPGPESGGRRLGYIVGV